MLIVLVMGALEGQTCDQPRPTLGIGVFDCRSPTCRILSVQGSPPDSRTWEVFEFLVEPRLSAIDPDGPAAGRIMDGDLLAAVDGEPITTRRGTANLGFIVEGRPVELTVRRAGTLLKVTLVPTLSCVRHIQEPRRIIVQPGGAKSLVHEDGDP